MFSLLCYTMGYRGLRYTAFVLLITTTRPIILQIGIDHIHVLIHLFRKDVWILNHNFTQIQAV